MNKRCSRHMHPFLEFNKLVQHLSGDAVLEFEAQERTFEQSRGKLGKCILDTAVAAIQELKIPPLLPSL
ncbi:hypothetical protein NDU88_010476 [Pleurodeles waltl]|uniref:Uncharacterized protein n=1 Tax=Pleurodeles waltl TaxID=8319 RepID=A0AAV7S1E2_PLEWA|nr:hypothetical protein NDU88_010476 [Pleurodeles waltl]